MTETMRRALEQHSRECPTLFAIASLETGEILYEFQSKKDLLAFDRRQPKNSLSHTFIIEPDGLP